MITGNINILRQATQPLQSCQRGISLIDALIALVIFSVGMLALASLQSISKQSNFEAIQRTHAASLAYDLFERMRMNKGEYLTYVPGGSVEYSYINDLTEPSQDCSANVCLSDQMAVWDIYEFQRMLRGDNEIANFTEPDKKKSVGGIVDPTVCITGPGLSGHDYTLTIVWRGQTSLENQNTTIDCGSGAYGANNKYRRILELSTYM